MPAEDDGTDLAQVAVLGALGVLAMGSGLVLATGAVAEVLFGQGIPPLALADAAPVLFSLPGTSAEPRLAWPANSQAVLMPVLPTLDEYLFEQGGQRYFELSPDPPSNFW